MGFLDSIRNFALGKGYIKEGGGKRRPERYEPEPEYDGDEFYDDEYYDDEPADTFAPYTRTERFDKALKPDRSTDATYDDGITPFSMIYNRAKGGRVPFAHRGPSYESSAPAPQVQVEEGSAKVVPFSKTGGNADIFISYPKSIDECCSISDYVSAGNTFIINLEGIRADIQQAQRIVDFLAGVVYTLDGDIQTVSNRVFVLVPRDVTINSEARDAIRFAGSFAPMPKAASFR